MDALQYATEGNLWNTPTIEIDFQPDEKYPKGTHVSILPIPGSSDESWKFAATLTTDVNSPKIGGYAYMEGRTTSEGTQVDDLTYSLSGMNEEQITSAMIGVAVNALTQSPRFSKSP